MCLFNSKEFVANEMKFHIALVNITNALGFLWTYKSLFPYNSVMYISTLLSKFYKSQNSTVCNYISFCSTSIIPTMPLSKTSSLMQTVSY